MKSPQISYGASFSELADKLSILIINKKFKLSTVNTISVENTYDIDICRALKNEAALVGINIESSHTFWPDTKNVKELFNKIISGSKNLRSFHDSL